MTLQRYHVALTVREDIADRHEPGWAGRIDDTFNLHEEDADKIVNLLASLKRSGVITSCSWTPEPVLKNDGFERLNSLLMGFIATDIMIDRDGIERFRVRYHTDGGGQATRTVFARDVDDARREAAMADPHYVATMETPRRLGPVKGKETPA